MDQRAPRAYRRNDGEASTPRRRCSLESYSLMAATKPVAAIKSKAKLCKSCIKVFALILKFPESPAAATPGVCALAALFARQPKAGAADERGYSVYVQNMFYDINGRTIQSYTECKHCASVRQSMRASWS